MVILIVCAIPHHLFRNGRMWYGHIANMCNTLHWFRNGRMCYGHIASICNTPSLFQKRQNVVCCNNPVILLGIWFRSGQCHMSLLPVCTLRTSLIQNHQSTVWLYCWYLQSTCACFRCGRVWHDWLVILPISTIPCWSLILKQHGIVWLYQLYVQYPVTDSGAAQCGMVILYPMSLSLTQNQ